MIYQEIFPSHALSNFVQCFWYLKTDYTMRNCNYEILWADGHPELIFHYGNNYSLNENQKTYLCNGLFIGPLSRYKKIYSKGKVEIYGIRFRPIGWNLIFNDAANVFLDKIIAIMDIWGSIGTELEERIYGISFEYIILIPTITGKEGKMIKRIATVGIYVEDQDQSLKFWTEKLDFEVNRDLDMGNGYRWIEVAPKGAESCLVIYPKQLMKNWQELKPSIVFQCENIEELCRELKEKGVKFSKELTEMAWGKFASFLDLDGNEFGLRG